VKRRTNQLDRKGFYFVRIKGGTRVVVFFGI